MEHDENIALKALGKIANESPGIIEIREEAAQENITYLEALEYYYEDVLGIADNVMLQILADKMGIGL